MTKDSESNLEKFKTTPQANIDEITETMQISETKTGASISELRETFDVRFQAVAEATEKH